MDVSELAQLDRRQALSIFVLSYTQSPTARCDEAHPANELVGATSTSSSRDPFHRPASRCRPPAAGCPGSLLAAATAPACVDAPGTSCRDKAAAS